MADAPQYAWMNGRLVAWEDASLHVDTQCVLGGLNAYEVVAACWSAAREELYLFRLPEHLRRLHYSAKVMRLPLAFADEALTNGAVELLTRSAFRENVSLRIVAYLGAGPVFSYRPEVMSTGVFMIAKPVPPARAQGLHVCTSRWSRLPDMAAPPRVKAGANYQNARLAQIQAQVDGYDDAIFLNLAGKVCELPLSNVFLARSGALITPDLPTGILEGITRQTILEVGPRIGIDITERPVDRSELYAADEMFASTTLNGITPILSVDRYPVGDGTPGPLTRRLARELERHYRADGDPAWVMPVYGRASGAS